MNQVKEKNRNNSYLLNNKKIFEIDIYSKKLYSWIFFYIRKFLNLFICLDIILKVVSIILLKVIMGKIIK